MSNPTPNYFLIIPSYILDDPQIDDATAILFGRIASLSNNKGYCFASDKYLAELTKVQEREVRNRLKTLEDCGYIKRETEKKGMYWDRKIYPNFNYERHIHASRTAQVDRIEGSQCAEEQDKRTNKEKNNNKTTESEVTSKQDPCKDSASGGVVVSSDEEKKRELLIPLKLTETAYKHALGFTLAQIQKAVDCCRCAKDMREINAYITSALKCNWEPAYPKEIEEKKQEAEMERLERDRRIEEKKRIRLKISELMEKVHSVPKYAPECNDSGFYIVSMENTINIPITEDGLRWLEIWLERKLNE